MRRYAIIFVTITALMLALVHVAIYDMVVTVFAVASPRALLIWKIVFAILCVSFIAASILSNFYDTWVTRVLYRFSAAWLGCVGLKLLSAIIFSGVILTGILPAAWVAPFGGILLVAALLGGSYGIVHANRTTITRISVTLPGLPASWKGRTAVLVTDLHLGQVRGAAFADKVAARIESLQPDAVFISGDLYDGVKVDVDAVIAPLARLKPPQGIYFVTGNHEEFHSNERFLAAIRRIGIRVLNNELVVADGLQILGVDDSDSNKKDLFPKVLSEARIDKTKAVILLKHQPTLLAVAERAGISLQLSGHTHKAQMWPFTYITRLVYKQYDYGLHPHGSMQVYTSSGAGTWGPPMRIGTRSEIVELAFS